LREDKDGVATLTLNRGDRHEPFSTAISRRCRPSSTGSSRTPRPAWSCSQARASISAPVTTCAKMRSHPDKAWQKALFEQCSEMMLSLVRLPQPVIARVQGVAVAAGCQLVAMCDLAVAGEAASSRSPGSRAASSAPRRAWASPATSARKHALEMLLHGRPDRREDRVPWAW